MRIHAISKRIVQQLLRDKRSIALMIIAPIMVMTLLWLVLDIDQYEPTIAVIDIPSFIQETLEEQDATIKPMDVTEAKQKLQDQEIDAYIQFDKGDMEMIMEGTNPTVTSAVQFVFSEASKQMNPDSLTVEVNFYHGSENLNIFDYTGPVLIGYFIFFFVFLIGGVSFLRERTQGTLERMLATPLKRWEIVTGYIGGFGIFIIIQSIVIVTFSVYVLNIYMVGSIVSVLFISFLLALTALSLGTLLSAYSKNEFQMIQFIPIVIIPQAFFTGIFHIDTAWLEAIGKIMPLTYGANALKDIMIRGDCLSATMSDIWVLIGFSAMFIFLNIIALTRHRAL